MRRLDLSNHLSEFVSNHWVLDEFLTKRSSTVRVLERFLIAHACKPIRLNHKPPTLVIEVVHDILEAFVFFADQILDWHFHVFKGDERGTARPNAHAVHAATIHARHRTLDD